MSASTGRRIPQGTAHLPKKTIKFTDLCGFFPKQWEATDAADQYRFVLFGGARGPGKSYWLRWYQVRFHLSMAAKGFRRLRTGLFCEDYPSLTDRQISKIETEFPSWLGEVRQSRKDGLGFHFNQKFGGGMIALRNLDDPNIFKSSEFALVGVDELTQNKKIDVFHILRGSLRWPGIENPKFIAASNPDGPGQEWVRTLWIERKFPPELMSLADQFVFVPGLAYDNPKLPPAYWDELGTLSPRLRRAWKEGDWWVTADDNQVKREWYEIVGAAPRDARRVRYWDKAGTTGAGDYAVGLLMAEKDGKYYIEDIVRGQWSVFERQKVEIQTSLLDAMRYGKVIWSKSDDLVSRDDLMRFEDGEEEIHREEFSVESPGVEIWIEQEGGSGGKDSALTDIKIMAGFKVRAHRPTGDKAVRAEPWIAQAEAGNIKLVRGDWNQDYINEVTTFPSGAHDDQWDATSGAFNKLAGRGTIRIHSAST